MNKLKVMPLFEIEGTQFIVDSEKQVLQEFQNPANEISFIDHMVDRQSHYDLRYDPGTKSAASAELSDDQVILVDVPQLTTLDPFNIARKYCLTDEMVKTKTDFEVFVDQEALATRHNGKLPLIDINGEAFVVDLRMQELRHAEFFFQIISLKAFEIAPDETFEAYYNTMMKQVIGIDPQLLEFPDHVVKIRIPSEVELDPVCIAREFGMDERELLRRFPIQRELKAEIIPLSETQVSRLIQQNKEKLQADHRENMKIAKPKFRPRF